jgi:hypothetical protein
VSDFCPDGYLPTRKAIVIAAKWWFPDKFAALQSAAAPESPAKPDNNLDAAVRAFSQPQVPDAWVHAFEDIASPTVHRLRNYLHEGKLKAYYFRDDGCHSVLREFWATAQANGVMESSTYWPFGEPTRWHEQRPRYPLLVKLSELEALLSEQPAEKPGLPRAKMPDLVAALRALDHLPNREKQREALRKLPEFERYHLTDDVFREAEKRVPRKSGRKPLRPEQ